MNEMTWKKIRSFCWRRLKGQSPGGVVRSRPNSSLLTYLHLCKKQMLLSKATYSGYTIFVSMCVSRELNPQTFALLTQCSTTEPQEHIYLNLPISTPKPTP